MNIIVAYVPYTRDLELIEIEHFSSTKDLVNFLTYNLGVYPEPEYFIEIGQPESTRLVDVIKWIDKNFAPDGSYGAVSITIMKDGKYLIQV